MSLRRATSSLYRLRDPRAGLKITGLLHRLGELTLSFSRLIFFFIISSFTSFFSLLSLFLSSSFRLLFSTSPFLNLFSPLLSHVFLPSILPPSTFFIVVAFITYLFPSSTHQAVQIRFRLSPVVCGCVCVCFILHPTIISTACIFILLIC